MKELWAQRATAIRGLIFAGIPIAFLVVVAVFRFEVAVPQARRARADAIASFQTLRAIDAVNEAVQDAERGQRGYLLTGQDSYLEPYVQAKARLPQLMANLQTAIPGGGDEGSRLLSLQADVTTKMNELASTLLAYRAGGLDSALAILNSDVGRQSMLEVGADLKMLADAEERRIQARSTDGDRMAFVASATFVVGSLGSAVALLVGALLLAVAHARAKTSEQVLQATLDSVREGVAAFDGAGQLRAWNAPFAKLLDFLPAELQRGQTLPTDRTMSPEADEIIGWIAELKASSPQTNWPTLISVQSARGRTLELFHRTVADGCVTTILDVTEQRQTEQALRQAQKLESLGHMTGGVAHDFNNLLTVIVGSLGFLRRGVGRDPKLSGRIDMLEIAAERGTRLTQQLLAFARRQPLAPEVVDLGEIMQEILPLLRRAVGEQVAVESVLTAGLWNTMIDVVQFQSALLNLAINSRDAMPEGGNLTIEVANVAIDDAYASRHADVEAGQYVLFAITDTGIGMEPAVLARALDPFFTTKPAGAGTGLGLPQVYGFVKQSGGHLKLYSEVGHGTTVRMYLPRSLQAPSHRPLRPPLSLAVTGTETVLLVDDDEIVRTTVAAMLEDLGYTVLTAANGAGALEILEQGRRVDLLFTDVVMPGMGGRQLAERALKLRPGLRILFTSGYTQNAIIHNGRLDAGVELLSKPYDRDSLAAKLRRLLDPPGRRGDTEDSGKA
jgi:signal transduction histidine kinase/ActR/RegA family two-component response regulator